MIKAIPYYRVSTERQGSSGLGLEAQKLAVKHFARYSKFKLLNGHVEVEGGRKRNRPVLQQALEECKRKNAILLIAKQDRLSRSVLFISTLIASGIPYIALDNPSNDKFMAHVNAAFAEKEHDEISDRTKKALKEAKKRGVILGWYGKNVLSKKNIRLADSFARKMRPVVKKLQKSGFTSIRKLTTEFNKRKIPTYSGSKGKWHVTTVYNLLNRIEKLNPINKQ